MKKVCLILGAGASVEFGAPCTSQLTKLIEDSLELNPIIKKSNAFELYLLIRNTLNSFLVKPGVINFEHLYHCIHEVEKFSHEVSAEAFDEFRFLLQPFLSFKEHMRDLNKEDQYGTPIIRYLEKEYIQTIYQKISESCAVPKCSLQPLTDFLGHLKNTHALRIYNLNYDDFCYQADPDLYTGFKKEKCGRFLRESFFDMEDQHSHFHLHGSIHMNFAVPSREFDIGDLAWFEDRKEALKHSSTPSDQRQMDGGSIALHPIVTGLDKLSRIQHAPFNYYYAMLPHDLFSSDLVILAGYGMSDIHVNNWLHQARLANPKQGIIVIDYMDADHLHFNASRKSIEWVHALRIKTAEPYVWKRGAIDGWHLVQDSMAAVWTKGFQAFLSDSSSALIQEFSQTGKFNGI